MYRAKCELNERLGGRPREKNLDAKLDESNYGGVRIYQIERVVEDPDLLDLIERGLRVAQLPVARDRFKRRVLVDVNLRVGASLGQSLS